MRCDDETIVAAIGIVAYTFGMVDRKYGGPEEGGWYYTAFEPIRVFYVPKKMGHRLAIRLRRYADKLNEGRREISSVLSEGRYAVRFGHEEHTPRPYYE